MITRKDLDKIVWEVLQKIVSENQIKEWYKSFPSLPKNYERVTKGIRSKKL